MRGVGGMHVKKIFKNFPKSEKKLVRIIFSMVETN